jgi:hypothetical protein
MTSDADLGAGLLSLLRRRADGVSGRPRAVLTACAERRSMRL